MNFQRISIKFNIATRPELLEHVFAIMVHPRINVFQKYQKKNVITPIYNTKVPIIMDKKIDPEKGTGLVMCCVIW